LASNYPTSLDNFTNPTSNDSLNSPSHSLQHADINDAVEAIEAKLGIGASSAGSATSGHVLTVGTGGTTTWSAPSIAGLTLVKSQTIGSAVSSVEVTGAFSATYDNYKVIVIGGVGSVFGANATNKSNQKMLDQQLKYNREEMQRNRQFERSERVASQDYQTSERNAQNSFMTDFYNQYQSPQALFEQYKAAGLNPRLAIDSSGAGSASASSGSSGSAPSGPLSSVPGLSMPYMNSVGYVTAFQNMAEAIKSLGEAKKTGIETDYLEEQLKKTLKGMELDNEAKALVNSINKKYLDKTSLAHLQSLLQDVTNKNLESEELRQRINGLVKDNIIKEYEADSWYQRFSKAMDLQQSQIDVNKSHKSLNEVEANLKKAQRLLVQAQTVTESTQPELNKALTRLNNIIGNKENLEYRLRKANSDDERKKIAAELKRETEEAINDAYRAAHRGYIHREKYSGTVYEALLLAEDLIPDLFKVIIPIK